MIDNDVVEEVHTDISCMTVNRRSLSSLPSGQGCHAGSNPSRKDNARCAGDYRLVEQIFDIKSPDFAIASRKKEAAKKSTFLVNEKRSQIILTLMGERANERGSFFA